MKRCAILIIFWFFSIALIFNNASANFSGPTPFGTGVTGSSIVLGDIDNDGDLDLIVTGKDNSGNYRLDKYTNDGSGNFSGTSFGTGVSSGSIALGDIDNDGDLDLIVTGWDASGNPRLDKYINDGSGNFSGTSFGTGVRYSSCLLYTSDAADE